MLFICTIFAPAPSAAATDVASQIAISSEGKISADIENMSLQDVVRLMVEKEVIKIRGSLPRGVLNPSRFFELAPEQALIKLMRGFNYALAKEHLTDKWTMMVLGQAKRELYKVEEKPAQRQEIGGQGPEKTRFRPYSTTLPPVRPSPAYGRGMSTSGPKNDLSREKNGSGSTPTILQNQQKRLDEATTPGADTPKADNTITEAK